MAYTIERAPSRQFPTGTLVAEVPDARQAAIVLRGLQDRPGFWAVMVVDSQGHGYWAREWLRFYQGPRS